jgi:hypothetical protein
VRGVGGWCETATSLGVSEGNGMSSGEGMSLLEHCCGSGLVSCYCWYLVAKARGQLGNPEEVEGLPLEAVLRKLVKTKQAEKT